MTRENNICRVVGCSGSRKHDDSITIITQENNINCDQFATTTFLRVHNILYTRDVQFTMYNTRRNSGGGGGAQWAVKNNKTNITGLNGSVKTFRLRWRYQCLNGCYNEPFCTILYHTYTLSHVTAYIIRMCVRKVFIIF